MMNVINETTTCITTTPLGYYDGIVYGVILVVVGLLIYVLIVLHVQRNLIRESIFNPEAFKVRQDEFNRKMKDW